MNDETRKLVKQGNNYVLEIDNKDAKLYQKKTYNKTEMKNNYDAIVTQIRMHKEQMSTIKKDLKTEPIYTEQEESIKAVVIKVLLNQKFDKLSTDKNRIEDELELFAKQKKEIEGLIPEFKRN